MEIACALPSVPKKAVPMEKRYIRESIHIVVLPCKSIPLNCFVVIQRFS
jgi:hypothetical protein